MVASFAFLSDHRRRKHSWSCSQQAKHCRSWSHAFNGSSILLKGTKASWSWSHAHKAWLILIHADKASSILPSILLKKQRLVYTAHRASVITKHWRSWSHARKAWPILLTEHQWSHAHRELADDQCEPNGLRVSGDAANYGGIGQIKGNRWRSYISYPPPALVGIHSSAALPDTSTLQADKRRPRRCNGSSQSKREALHKCER